MYGLPLCQSDQRIRSVFQSVYNIVILLSFLNINIYNRQGRGSKSCTSSELEKLNFVSFWPKLGKFAGTIHEHKVSFSQNLTAQCNLV